MRIVGPNFIVRLSAQDNVVVEAARPISYMKGWKLERVRALCRRWDWKIELSDVELVQQARAQAQAGPQPQAAPGGRGRGSSEASREGEEYRETWMIA